jgi:branched-chain amino acid transport system ATP-binding protein
MNGESKRLLWVENLSKQFGGFTAVSDLSFELTEGEILGLVGPNGAGKTTVFNLITGFLPPTWGKIFFMGRDITSLKTHQIARIGLVRTFQLNKVFSSLSVEENIRIGCHLFDKGGFSRFLIGSTKKEKNALNEKVDFILNLVGLDSVREKVAEDLPYGDQKLLGIGVSMGADPKLLLLDEPFAGMNPVETARCVTILRQIVAKGTTLFLVDHDMRAVMGTCKRIVVLNFGKKIAEGRPDEIRTNPQVIASYLGSLNIAQNR